MQYESEYYGVTELGDSLMHHGVKGQKHGTRRWQYEDGSLTPAGRIHYGVGEARDKARTDKKPAKFSEWAKDQAKYNPSFSSVRLATEGIAKDVLKVMDIFGGSKKTDELGRLSNDIADRTLAGDLVPIKKGKIDDVVNKYGTEEEKKALTADKLDKYTQDTYGLSNKDLNRLKNMSADEKQKMANGIKLAQQLMDKGHNPDGSLTDRNMKKLIKSVINHPGVGLDLDKFADTEKKQEFVKAKDAVDKQHENVRKIEDDFYNNTKLADKYIAKSAEKRWNSMSVFEQNNFPGGKAGYINWHLKDDGDQGNGFELYYQEKHYKSSDKKAYDIYNKALNAYAKELTGQNANRTAVGKDMFGKKTNRTRTYEDIVKTSLQFAKTSAQRNAESRAKALKASGKTNAEIADLLGISTFTVYEYLN